MYQTNNQHFLEYPEVFFQMPEYHGFLNKVDMSVMAQERPCSIIQNEENVNFMRTMGKIERNRFDRKRVWNEAEIL